MMATTERKIIHQRTRESITTPGKNGSEKRMKPYVPIFSKTPARITEPAVGASTWASGSQVWNGNIGTLIANPANNSRKIQTCGFDHVGYIGAHSGQFLPTVSSPRVSSGIEKVNDCVSEYWYWTTTSEI